MLSTSDYMNLSHPPKKNIFNDSSSFFEKYPLLLYNVIMVYLYYVIIKTIFLYNTRCYEVYLKKYKPKKVVFPMDLTEVIPRGYLTAYRLYGARS